MTTRVKCNPSYGLPLTRGGALRCTPALQAAAPRCWDSPARDDLRHAHFARGGDNDGEDECTKSRTAICDYADQGCAAHGKETIMSDLTLSTFPPMLFVEDLMPILSISRNRAYKLVQNGEIHSVKIGRVYRIPLSAVEAFIEGKNK